MNGYESIEKIEKIINEYKSGLISFDALYVEMSKSIFEISKELDEIKDHLNKLKGE